MTIDPQAERGFASGADDYDRYRPGWPAEAVERVLAALGVGPESTVVDLAAGTGKLTRELVPRVGRVIAVEPLGDMRRRLRDVVPQAEAVDGQAQAMPLDDASVDAVLVAEAFHWFATPDAVREIARVVRPGGGVALFWNLHQAPDEDWLTAAGPVLGKLMSGVQRSIDRHQPESWRPPFDGAGFGPFEELSVPHEQHTDVDGMVGLISTWSHARLLGDDEREELLGELREVFERESPTPDDVVIPYRTLVYWARRQAPPR